MGVQEESESDKDVELCNKKGKHKPITSSSSRQPKKLKKSTGESMVDALTAMASAVSSLVEQKKETYNSIKAINVVEALDAIPDLEEDIYMDACDLLEDEGKSKIFVSLDVSKRKTWLIRKLRSHGFY
uniref:At2g29880-like C-terminal domain-containing protein n=1 Tax=Davidia involucrata TaxID=16924 RepID=A0A5B7CCL9_DAVIN